VALNGLEKGLKPEKMMHKGNQFGYSKKFQRIPWTCSTWEKHWYFRDKLSRNSIETLEDLLPQPKWYGPLEKGWTFGYTRSFRTLNGQPEGRMRPGRTESRPGFEQVLDLQVFCADCTHGRSLVRTTCTGRFGGPSCLAKHTSR
jgi:hypothetical protein